MKASGTDILKFIPQRAPMVMVDLLVDSSATRAITGLTVESGNIFVEDGLLQEPGIVEHIAQSAALQAGYQYVEAGIPVPIGYIAGIKDLSISRLPKVNSRLLTIIEVTNQIMGVTLVQGTVREDEEQIANCEMRIFIRE